ncbi:MAG: hypothetical protein ACP5RC_13175 [Halothiobacillaceae bacterium]
MESGSIVRSLWIGVCEMVDFKDVHCPKAVIVHAVFFYRRYAVPYLSHPV